MKFNLKKKKIKNFLFSFKGRISCLNPIKARKGSKKVKNISKPEKIKQKENIYFKLIKKIIFKPAKSERYAWTKNYSPCKI
jgi:hypothetical protein